jgi:integrase/recombinase XerD
VSIHIADAQLVTAIPPRGRTRAETHALGFLSRYRVEHTRRGYEIALRQWFAFCQENGIDDPLLATRVDIELFARELELTGRRLATVGGKLNVLAGFYRHAVLDGLIDDDPMVNVVRPPVQRTSTTNGLTRPEFADVLREAENHPPRDHAVICLLGLNGMRVSEVCGIDIDDIGRHQGHRTVRILRKGGKYQTIPMAPRTTWQVELAMGERTTGPLLLDHTGTKRIDRRAAARIVDRVVAGAGIRKRITPHSLRHTYVTLSLDAGATDRDVAASVGHADTRLVAYYDRGRESIARNTTYAVAAFVEGAS